METYRERLWPSPWIVVIAALAIPASMLVLAPVSVLAGALSGIAMTVAVIALAAVSAPVITVGDGMLRAGAARIPLAQVGAITFARREAARRERGQDLDARAYLVLRGDIDPIARITVTDPEDPVPYWVVSTRRPEALAAAVASAKAANNRPN
jgi:hypothetical protein